MSPGVMQSRYMPDAKFVHFPAPAGLNTITPAGIMPITECNVLWNMIGGEEGARVRLGYREWVTGCTGTTDAILTILPFKGSTPSADKLFCTTNTGIWDVTDSSAAPSQVLVFADSTGDAGYGQVHTFVTATASPTTYGHFLVYCDEQNGMHTYSETTATWTATAMGATAGSEITGVNPNTFVGVCGFKERLFFIQRGTAKAWYTDAGCLFGDLTGQSFNFGSKFKSGGGLRNLYNLTYDGGGGMDDSLVAISDGGDVAVYQGDDIATAGQFAIKGVWSVGAIPAGRNIGTDFGGDLLILSKTGILPLSRLVAGAQTEEDAQYATYKIGPEFNRLTLATGAVKGWSMRIHPEDNALIVTVPTSAGANTNQLAMSLATKGWSRYRDLPMLCNGVLDGKMYFGSKDGIIYLNEGYVDNLLLDGVTYTDIAWSFVTSFQNWGNGRQKQVGNIRATIRCNGGLPSYGVGARYRYDLTELGAVTAASNGTNTWGSGLWGTATWSGGYGTTQAISGAVGMGPEFAIAAKGNSRARTVVVGFDVSFRQGGFY